MQIKNLYKAYGNHVVYKDFSMDIPKGEWTNVRGPSGCGKTTLLRILMGLEKADAGNLIWDACGQGNDSQTHRNASSKMCTNKISSEAARPKITAVFQEDRLCMNESAVRNAAMVLHSQDVRRLLQEEKTKNSPAADISEVITSHFARVGLTDQEALRQPVSRLSGGMRRRVAIVRAVMAPGDMLLFDEPFQGLDEDTKRQVIRYMKEEQRGRTVVLVTHDGEAV